MKQTKIYTINFASFLAIMLLGTSCPDKKTNDPGSQISGGTTVTTTIDKDKSNKKVKSNAPAPPGVSCPPGSIELSSQHINASASIRLGEEGPSPVAPELPSGVMEITVTVTNGKYTATIQALNPDCKTVGPSKDITINFSLMHRSYVDLEGSNPTCVWRSGVTFQSFSYTGIPFIDDFVLNMVKDDILKEMDFTVDDQMNRITHSNQALPSNADPRCPDWQSF